MIESINANIESTNDVLYNKNIDTDVPSVLSDVSKIEESENIDAPVSDKIVDVGADSKYEVSLITRNESLEGDIHPMTGVPFERRNIETDDEIIDGVFPNFDSEFDAEIPKDMYNESDRKQFNECNEQLNDKLESDSEFVKKFDKEQIEQIENGDTPDGYVWHHDAEPGKIQLVDFETHASTGHTGGRTVWGGGSENR